MPISDNEAYTFHYDAIRGVTLEASWRYSEIPHALGCDGWFTARVTTCGEFDQALKAAEQDGTAAYIEVVTDTYAAPPIAKKMHESLY
jgi:indolepyruvate decarboxylase